MNAFIFLSLFSHILGANVKYCWILFWCLKVFYVIFVISKCYFFNINSFKITGTVAYVLFLLAVYVYFHDVHLIDSWLCTQHVLCFVYSLICKLYSQSTNIYTCSENCMFQSFYYSTVPIPLVYHSVNLLSIFFFFNRY